MHSRGTAIAILLSLIALGVGCTSEQDVEGPTILDAEVDTTLVIGTDAATDPAYALGDPVGVAVDSTGRLYVADNSLPAVRVYDSTGTYRRTIGGKGPGPGEFRDIQALHVHGDTLTVVCATEVEQFRLDGAPIRTRALPHRASWISLRRPDGQWVLGSYRGEGRSDSLLYVYTTAFETAATTFGTPSAFVDDNLVSRTAISQHVGSLASTRDGGLLFTPYLYEGRIVEYKQADGAWHRTGTWSGYTEREAYAYEKRSADAPPQTEMQIYSMERGERVVFGAMYFNKSLGLFRGEKGVFHFTSIARGNHRLVGAEVYGPAGTMQGYVPLTKIATDEDGVPTEVTPTPEAVGPDGAFYLIEKGYDAVPKVLVLSLRVDGIE